MMIIAHISSYHLLSFSFINLISHDIYDNHFHYLYDSNLSYTIYDNHFFLMFSIKFYYS